MYSRNWNKGFSKRRTILQLDDDSSETSASKHLPRTGSSNALTALGSYDNGDDEEEQAERTPEPVVGPSPQEEVNGTNQRDPTPPPTPATKPGKDIDMQVANFLAEIESIDTVTPEEGGKEEEEEETIEEEEEEETFNTPEPKTVWQQCLDDGTQCYYYWHLETNEVTWEIPEDYTRYLLQYKEYEEANTAFEARKAVREEEKKNQKEAKKHQTKSKPSTDSRSTPSLSAVTGAPLPKDIPHVSSVDAQPPVVKTIGPELPDQCPEWPHPETSVVEGPQLPGSVPQTIGQQLFSEYPDSPEEQKSLYGHLAKYASESNDDNDPVGPKVQFSRSGLGATGSSRSNSPLPQSYDKDSGQKEFDWFRRDQRGSELVKKEEKKTFTMKFIKGKTLDEEKVDMKEKSDEAPAGKQIDRNELLQRIRSGGSSWLKTKKKASVAAEPEQPEPVVETTTVATVKAEDEDEEAMLERELAQRKAELEQLERAEEESVDGEADMTPEPSIKRESPESVCADTLEEDKPPPAKKIKTETEAVEDNTVDQKFNQKDQEIEIDQLSSTITSKLEFLDITRKGLSKLQILLIETQTRLVDWVEGGLSTHHLLKKLNDADNQIKQYELGAAPKGWSCHWDRDYKRYFYQNNETGSSQWEYPLDGGDGYKEDMEASSSALEEEVDSSEGRMVQDFNAAVGEGQDITSTFTGDVDQSSLHSEETMQPPPPEEPSSQPPLPPEPEPPPLPPSSPPPPPSSPPPPLPQDDQPSSETLEPPPPPPGFDTNFVPPPPPPILSGEYSPPPLPPGTENNPTSYLPHSPIQEVDMDIDDSVVDSTVPDLQPPPMPPFPRRHSMPNPFVSSSHGFPSGPYYHTGGYNAMHHGPGYMVVPPPPPPPCRESGDSHDSSYPTSSRPSALDKPAHLSAQPVLFRESQTSAAKTTVASAPTTYAPDTTTSGATEKPPQPSVPATTSQTAHSASQLAMSLAATVTESGKKKKKDKIKMKSGGALSLKKKNVSSMVQKWQKAQQEVEKEIAQAAARAKRDTEDSS